MTVAVTIPLMHFRQRLLRLAVAMKAPNIMKLVSILNAKMLNVKYLKRAYRYLLCTRRGPDITALPCMSCLSGIVFDGCLIEAPTIVTALSYGSLTGMTVCCMAFATVLARSIRIFVSWGVRGIRAPSRVSGPARYFQEALPYGIASLPVDVGWVPSVLFPCRGSVPRSLTVTLTISTSTRLPQVSRASPTDVITLADVQARPVLMTMALNSFHAEGPG